MTMDDRRAAARTAAMPIPYHCDHLGTRLHEVRRIHATEQRRGVVSDAARWTVVAASRLGDLPQLREPAPRAWTSGRGER